MVKAASIEIQDGVTVIRFPRQPGQSGADAARGWIASDFLASTQGSTRLVVDLDGVPALDSAALGPLIQRLREMQAHDGRMALCSVTAPALREVFSLTRFDQVFPIYPSLTEAMKAVREDPSSRFARSR